MTHHLRFVSYLDYETVYTMLLPVTLLVVMFASLADNGMISATLLSSLKYEQSFNREEDYLMLAALIIGGLFLYVLFTLLFLRLAKTIAYRQGVNNDAFVIKTKSKRKIEPVTVAAPAASTQAN